MNKNYIFSAWFILLAFLSSQSIYAAGEAEYILEKKITSVTPLFMEGHPGDINWIEGFTFEGNNFIAGIDTPVGTFEGEASLLNPPLRTAEYYDEAFIKWVNVLPGIGSFNTVGMSVALGSSSTETTVAWYASISNGTGALSNNFGLSAGNGVINIFTGQGSITEVINIRSGY